jgi:copper(I)-binding protein
LIFFSDRSIVIRTHVMKLNLIAAAAASCLLAATAQAHVTLEKPEAANNQPYKGVLRIGHGCAGSPTVSLSVEIPDGLVAVKPMPKPGWTLSTERGDYKEPVTVFGQKLTGGTKKITWSGGRVQDSEYDEFIFVGQVSGATPGSTLYLPSVQTCEKGENRWVEIPKAGQTARDLTYPAAVLRIDGGKSESKSVQAGPVRIEQAWSRATPGGTSVGAGYLRVTNTGSTPDRLTGGTTDVAQRFELHEMAMDAGIMKMRPLANGIALQPGQSVELRPGGLHVMLVGLKQPLKAGDTFTATLQFEKAGTVQVEFPIAAIGAPAPGAATGGGTMMQGGGMMQMKPQR